MWSELNSGNIKGLAAVAALVALPEMFYRMPGGAEKKVCLGGSCCGNKRNWGYTGVGGYCDAMQLTATLR